jgi:MFS family permease
MSHTSAFKAGRSVLIFLTLINLFNYLDRYILLALGPAIQRDLGFDDIKMGFLASAFLLSYFLISPLFGVLGDRGPRLKLMSLGVALWSAATAFCGLGRSAGQLITARIFVGVGEAAYGSISPSVLRDLFPKEVSGRVFSIFFMAIPVGSALGFLLGGLLEGLVGWRAAFFVAGVPGLFLAAGLLFLKEPKRGAFDHAATGEERSFGVALRELWLNRDYVITVLGYCAYTFVVGGVAVWIPHYIERNLGVPAAKGNMVFGAITVAAGFLGTMLGGAWADRWQARAPDGYLKLSALSMLAAVPVYLLVLGVNSFVLFCVFTFVLEFLFFLSTSPVNAQIVNCVSPRIRSTANAIAIFAIHILGDAISPPMVGYISERTGNLHAGMQLFTVAILLSGLIWAWKVLAEWETLPWPAGALSLPRAQCHRGFHVTAQENTLEAFRAAAAAGAEMVELDVRLSRDGQAVVIHDPDISRVAGGRAGLVRELGAAELWDRAKAPALLEVLRDPACRQLKVNIELKHCPGQNAALAAAACRAVEEAGASGRVLFSSFNPLLLRCASRILPHVPRALLATGERDPDNRFYLRKMYLAFLARPHMLNYDGRYLTPALASSLRHRRVPFAVWTVEDPAEARKFLAMGAESIISPLPKIL